MRPRSYSSEAIILARKNYSEADRILIVFSKSYGKLHLIAKGVRFPKSRKRGHIEVFSRVKLFATKGHELGMLTEVEVVDSFPNIRKDLKRVAVAYFLLEVIGRITQKEEKNESLYNLLADTLNGLQSTKNLRAFRKAFIYEALVILGFWPRGKLLLNPDATLEDILEKRLVTRRVGKKILE